MTVPVGGRLQGWFLLTGLPWNLPDVPGICVGPPPTLDGTSSQAHQLAMSLTGKKDRKQQEGINLTKTELKRLCNICDGQEVE